MNAGNNTSRVQARNAWRRVTGALAALLICAVLGAEAHAQTLVSNTGQTPTGSKALLRNLPNAQGFRTGPHPDGYTLNSIRIDIHTEPANSSQLTVTLREADTQGLPHAPLATLTNPDPLRYGLMTFTAPAGTILKADTLYFVALHFSGGDSPGLHLTNGNREDGASAAGWSIQNDRYAAPGGGWITFPQTLRIAVLGTPYIKPPEPPCLRPSDNNNYQCVNEGDDGIEGTDDDPDLPKATWLDNDNILVEFNHNSFTRDNKAPAQNNPDNYDCEDYYMTMRSDETFPGRRVKCEGDGFDRYAGDSYWGIPDTPSCRIATTDDGRTVSDQGCAIVIKANIVNDRPSSAEALSPQNDEVVKILYPAQYRHTSGGESVCGLDPQYNTTNSTPCSWWSKQIDVQPRTDTQQVQEVVVFLPPLQPSLAQQHVAEPVCVPSAVLPQNLRGSWTYVTQCFENDCSPNSAWRDIGYLWTFNSDPEDRDYIDRLDSQAREYKYIEWYGGNDWGEWTWFLPEWCDAGDAGTQAEEPLTVAVQEVACEPSGILPQNSLGGSYSYVTQCFQADCGPNEAWNDIGYVDTSSANPDDRDVIGQIDLSAQEYKYIEQDSGGQWGAWTWFTPQTCD